MPYTTINLSEKQYEFLKELVRKGWFVNIADALRYIIQLYLEESILEEGERKIEAMWGYRP